MIDVSESRSVSKVDFSWFISQWGEGRAGWIWFKSSWFNFPVRRTQFDQILFLQKMYSFFPQNIIWKPPSQLKDSLLVPSTLECQARWTMGHLIWPVRPQKASTFRGPTENLCRAEEWLSRLLGSTFPNTPHCLSLNSLTVLPKNPMATKEPQHCLDFPFTPN